MTDRLIEAARRVLECLDGYKRDENERIEEFRAALAEADRRGGTVQTIALAAREKSND